MQQEATRRNTSRILRTLTPSGEKQEMAKSCWDSDTSIPWAVRAHCSASWASRSAPLWRRYSQPRRDRADPAGEYAATAGIRIVLKRAGGVPGGRPSPTSRCALRLIAATWPSSS